MEFCEREYKEIVSVTESLVDKAIEKEKKHFEKNSGPYLYANIYSFMNNCVSYCMETHSLDYNNRHYSLYRDLVYSYVFEKTMRFFELDKKGNNCD